MAEVTAKRDILTAASPHAETPDIWADFRQIEVLTLELRQRYEHSLGKYSRFFIELENGRFLGTRCARCQRVYAPPRPLCPACLAVTTWQELAGTGTLITYAVQHFGSGANDDVNRLATPYVLAYVLLDGASTLFPHILRAAPENVRIGMRVRVAYSSGPVQHPLHLMYFVAQG
ncbi:MAG: Zn-ribbon domain-containing OB-fold protein [Chloroflexi bacterium]|nr:Zn-ribbon domain-containing OB-fold protein [Chloroflexota bacterium]